MTWLDVLNEQCEKTSQSHVSRLLGVSAAMVNQALKGTYKGNLSKLETKVRGAFMADTVECPILGQIPLRECLENSSRPFAATNPQRVALYRACRNGCPWAENL